jgi:hypothetical protein
VHTQCPQRGYVEPKVQTQCIAHVLAIKHWAAGYGGLWARHAQSQGPGEDEQQDCQGQVKSGEVLVKCCILGKMLHTKVISTLEKRLEKRLGKSLEKSLEKVKMT